MWDNSGVGGAGYAKLQAKEEIMQGRKMVKDLLKIVTVLVVIAIMTTAWAPWLTEDYGKEKVLEYFSQKYDFNKNDIIITSVEKKPFEMHFGLSLPPSNNSFRRSYVHAWITFYGEVKHDEIKRLD